MHDNGCILYPLEAKIINDSTEDHEILKKVFRKNLTESAHLIGCMRSMIQSLSQRWLISHHFRTVFNNFTIMTINVGISNKVVKFF